MMIGSAPQELISSSATQQASWSRNRRVSSVELVQAHLDQISRVNPDIHAAVVRCGVSVEGLPIEVQLVSRPYREDIVLAAALLLESALGG
jgi:Asp-tRNA(Asn)/Glu-tRNA(Gln) amidotransferase A subunit family amidase